MLITEAVAGRVLKTDPAGRTVWKWMHEPFDDAFVADVLEGIQYQLIPAKFAARNCS